MVGFLHIFSKHAESNHRSSISIAIVLNLLIFLVYILCIPTVEMFLNVCCYILLLDNSCAMLNNQIVACVYVDLNSFLGISRDIKMYPNKLLSTCLLKPTSSKYVLDGEIFSPMFFIHRC